MTDDHNDQVQPLPKGRRAEAKAARRQDLIHAAIKSIATYGLSGTTMARVTKIAGTSLGLANFHFESKERLIEAVMLDATDREAIIMRKRNVDPSRSNKQKLYDLIDIRFHPDLFNREKISVWLNIYGTPSTVDVYRKLVEPTDDAWLDAVEELLEDMQEATGRRWVDTEHSALGFAAYIDGLQLNHLVYPEYFDLAACRKQAINFVAALFPEQVPMEHIEAYKAN
jgi:TetR/AcrR family transcriptional regulator, transcriptional repressor of bet genes